jgi:hypothetical protein
MSNSYKRTFSLFSALLVLVIASIACSSSTDSKTAEDISSPSYETCEGFVTAENLGGGADPTGLIHRARVIPIASIPGLADSGATANCLIELFRTIDGDDSPVPGDSITISLVQFESREVALNLYNSTLAAAILTGEQVGDLAEILQGVVGEYSYLMDVKAGGVGAIVVFVSGSTFVSMSSMADAESNALLDGQELVDSAQGVQSRLP